MTELLSYCTNVHPAEDLRGVLAQFDRYAVPVRERLGADRLGLGLWLAADLARELAEDPAAVKSLRAELLARGLSVLSLNAFPHRGFHDEVVKHSVYRPTWAEPARLRYTEDCAVVLSGLLDDDVEFGSISTLPLGWRTGWTAVDDDRATAAFEDAQEFLADLRDRTGRPIRLAVEPEPGCVLDELPDTTRWLRARVDPDLVGLCLDTCHLAVGFAEPERAVSGIAEAGLRVFKVQISAALHVADPADPAAGAALAEFAEARYLHQVRELGADRVRFADDLPAPDLPRRGPWRVHVHVPLHLVPEGPLATTTEVTRRALAEVDRVFPDRPPHREVETYTWSVLPNRHRQDLVRGIAAELSWVRDNALAMHIGGAR